MMDNKCEEIKIFFEIVKNWLFLPSFKEGAIAQ